ncbi:hypothetical protein [Pseudokordiimonas caeni]|uniref:hypothetical protein n=1 Tax=Pseudokordiimonas caeni TaxID=2997908 RepID=UPI00281232FD|nr:hypothetical protein [Pseudokordiimonas caeni]
MNTKLDSLTFAGAFLLVLGCFVPMFDFRMVGTVSYYDINNPDVYVLLVAAALAPALIRLRKRSLAILGPALAWGVLLWPMLRDMGKEDNALMDKLKDAVSDPLRQYAGNIFEHIDADVLAWGGYVFLAGLLLYTLAGVLVSATARK